MKTGFSPAFPHTEVRAAADLSATLPVLPDLLQPDLDLVFCGTAASRRSAAEQAYYAHPGNLFWRTLYSVGLTPRLFEPGEFRGLSALKLGLTDLAKRHAGNDSELPADAFDARALMRKMAHYQPRWLAFTSKSAGRAALGHPVTYGEQPEAIGKTALFVLPSPSGQARGHWDERWWKQLSERVRQRQ